MAYVCRRYALQFDRAEQLARELDARVIQRTKALTEETEARKSMMLNISTTCAAPCLRSAVDWTRWRLHRRPCRPCCPPYSSGRPFSAA